MHMHKASQHVKLSAALILYKYFIQFHKFTFVRGGGSTSSDPTFTSRPPTAGSGGAL